MDNDQKRPEQPKPGSSRPRPAQIGRDLAELLGSVGVVPPEDKQNQLLQELVCEQKKTNSLLSQQMGILKAILYQMENSVRENPVRNNNVFFQPELAENSNTPETPKGKRPRKA